MDDFTLSCFRSTQEAARIIELYKQSEHKSPASIMERQFANINVIEDRHKCVQEALSTIKSINKTDSLALVTNFESLEKIVTADSETLSMCPGLGPQKAEHLYKAFHTPFIRKD